MYVSTQRGFISPFLQIFEHFLLHFVEIYILSINDTEMLEYRQRKA